MKLLGVDLGIRKVALTLFEDSKLMSARAWETPKDVPRDAQLHELAAAVHDNAYLFDVDSVWMEDVLIGNNRKYSMQLAETKGAVSSGLYPLRIQFGTDIRTVNVGTWKKQVIGNGKASKEDVQNYIRVTHSPYAPLCGDDQDLYDAACVGLYGLLIHRRARDLQLT